MDGALHEISKRIKKIVFLSTNHRILQRYSWYIFKFCFSKFNSVLCLIPCSNLNLVVFQPIIQYTFVVQQRKSPIDTSKLPITIKAIPTMVLTSTMMVSLDMYFLMKNMPLLCCVHLDIVQDWKFSFLEFEQNRRVVKFRYSECHKNLKKSPIFFDVPQ